MDGSSVGVPSGPHLDGLRQRLEAACRKGCAEYLGFRWVLPGPTVHFMCTSSRCGFCCLIVDGAGPWCPYRAILRYYCCDTPYRAIPFRGVSAPQNGAIPPPPLALSFTEAHLCDIPFCYISHDNCAIHHKNEHQRIVSDTVARTIAWCESVAAGPLKGGDPFLWIEQSYHRGTTVQSLKKCFVEFSAAMHLITAEKCCFGKLF